MTKLELMDRITNKNPYLSAKDVKLAVDLIILHMSEHLGTNERIEVRGFGSFRIRHIEPYTSRNPREGTKFDKEASRRVHFKPGKIMRANVNQSMPKRQRELRTKSVKLPRITNTPLPQSQKLPRIAKTHSLKISKSKSPVQSMLSAQLMNKLKK